MANELNLYSVFFLDQDWDYYAWTAQAPSAAVAMRNMLADCIPELQGEILKLENAEQIDAFAAARNIFVSATLVGAQVSSALRGSVVKSAQRNTVGLERAD